MKGFILLILMISTNFAQYQINSVSGWRGIVPLHSSKEDVEKLFGMANNGPEGSYKFQDATVHFTYSRGPCKNGWDVPENKVLYISVMLRNNRPVFSSLNIDIARLEKKIDQELPDITYYVNNQEGITYVVNAGELTGMMYKPSARDESLKCK